MTKLLPSISRGHGVYPVAIPACFKPAIEKCAKDMAIEQGRPFSCRQLVLQLVYEGLLARGASIAFPSPDPRSATQDSKAA